MLRLESLHAKRAALIYNPVARGISRRRYLLQRTIDLLDSQGIDAKLVATEAAGTAGAQAREQIDSGCDLIIAAGGDGTINEVANGMLYTGVPLAILPGGTANVLAREMRLPRYFLHAAQRISTMRPYRIAVGSARLGEVEPRCFLCMAGAGLDAEIVSRLNLRFKAFAGKFAYYATGFGQVFRTLREFEVLVDGKAYLASFALISRVRNYGGDLEIARNASLLRNDFEVVLFRGTISLQYLRYLVGVALRAVNRMSGVTVLRGRTITMPEPESAGIFVQLDGELAGELPTTVEILPGALTILLPERYVSREQSLIAVPAYA